MMDIPLLYPHEVLHYVHSVVGLTVDKNVVRRYWQFAAAKGLGWATKQTNWQAIPIGLYADETKYGLHESQEKVLGIFLNLVLFRPRSIRLSRFLICAFRTTKLMLPGNRTLLPIFDRIVWSLGWASRGVFPDRGMHGEPLAPEQAQNAGKQLGGEFFVTELRGDLAWHKLIWGFPDGWKSTRVCFFCNATQTGRNQQMLYTSTGEQAPWRATIYRDVLTWMIDKVPLDSLCPLILLPNFDIDVIRMCSMHNLNLGLVFIANGSSLCLGFNFGIPVFRV
ncbi:unnamed protein product [Symbiodinium sp. CCMP2592]|nr:unnamed protein product [Symbiodinium sp. CCMP2592]